MRTRHVQSSSDQVPPSSTRETGHQSVLLHEAIDGLHIQASDVVVDGTLGAAGYAREIVQKLGIDGVFAGFDLDEDAIARTQDALQAVKPRIVLIRANFRHIQTELEHHGIHSISKAVFDLGWSGFQLSAKRGFSFAADEPLLMTYSKDAGGLSATEIVNEWEESSIADVLYGWGEERYSRRIARGIMEARALKPIQTAKELAEIIRRNVPGAYARGRLHPATKSFQALRIAVNDELNALRDGLEGAWRMLVPGGRIAVITFHSIEDRAVKHMFMEWQKNGEGVRVNKKPVIASKEELGANPRARSAKLRIISKHIEVT